MLTVTLDGGHASGLVVPADVISASTGEVVHEAALEAGRATSIDVPPGQYTVLARFPSGRSMAIQTDGRDEIVMPLPRSAHEFLEYQTAIGGAPALDRYSPYGRSTRDEPWVQLWTTEPIAWPRAYSDGDGTSWVIGFQEELERGMHYLVVGSSTGAARVVVLPAECQPSVTIRTKGPGTGKTGDFDVAVSSTGPFATATSDEARRIESVLLCLHEQRVDKAAMMAAQRLLFEKLHDPTGAAVGGYYLLLSGAYDRMHDWPGNFEHWKSYLPDAAVIHGLQSLWGASGGSVDHESAAHSLIRASLLGPPLLTIGLRLLQQGLERLRAHLADPALDGALRIVNSYVAAADPDKPYTTFLGFDPRRPSMQPTSGVPIDRTHLHWLSSLTTGWWDFPAGIGPTRPAGRTNIFVEPDAHGDWRVVRDDAPAVDMTAMIERFPTKASAVAAARDLALAQTHSRLVVYRSDFTTERVQIFDSPPS